jgi:mannitol-1-phosphate/altronate dehydrogenase
MAERLRAAATSDDPVAAVLAIEAVFPARLAADTRFREAVAAAHDRLTRAGAAAAVRDYVR